jgi:hypothetical protein
MVIDGHSLADVCEWLDSLHLRQKRDPVTGELADVPWWPTVLSKMIRNPAYRGHYWMTRVERDPETGAVVWSGKWEHSCEALIDARRFRLANEALAAREKRGPKGDPMSRAMLRGAIRCPDCGSPMNKIKTRASSKQGSSGTITYYRCWGRGSRPKGCGNMVRMDVADAALRAAERLHAAARPAPAVQPRAASPQPQPAPQPSSAAQLAGLSFPKPARAGRRQVPGAQRWQRPIRLRHDRQRLPRVPSLAPRLTATVSGEPRRALETAIDDCCHGGSHERGKTHGCHDMQAASLEPSEILRGTRRLP